jgi:hypothetical protein
MKSGYKSNIKYKSFSHPSISSTMYIMETKYRNLASFIIISHFWQLKMAFVPYCDQLTIIHKKI